MSRSFICFKCLTLNFQWKLQLNVIIVRNVWNLRGMAPWRVLVQWVWCIDFMVTCISLVEAMFHFAIRILLKALPPVLSVAW